MLTSKDRALGHKLAGEWLETIGETEAMVVAEHFERGGERARAVAWYRRAAEQALEGNDLAGTLAHVARAIACGAEGEALGALRLLEAEAYSWRGEPVKAAAAGEEAMRLLPEGGALWFGAASETMRASMHLGHHDRMTEMAAALRRLPPVAEEVLGAQVNALARTASGLLFAGRFDNAEELLDRIRGAMGTLGDRPGLRDPSVTGRVLLVRGVRELFAGDPAMFRLLHEAAADHFAEAGDVRHEAEARVKLGFASMLLGDYGSAERALGDAQGVSERLGQITSLRTFAQHNLGLALAFQGKYEQAERVERSALDSAVAHRNIRLICGCRLYLARILVLRGRLEEADEQSAAALAGAANQPTLEILCLATRAYVKLAQRLPVEALEWSEQAAAKLVAVEKIDEGEAFIRLAHAEALHATGDIDGARAAIATARARLLQQADRIADPDLHKGFLSNVPEHARTLELAEQWAASS
jgi:tetratricopeptide (TPR) repeat protein